MHFVFTFTCPCINVNISADTALCTCLHHDQSMFIKTISWLVFMLPLQNASHLVIGPFQLLAWFCALGQ